MWSLSGGVRRLSGGFEKLFVGCGNVVCKICGGYLEDMVGSLMGVVRLSGGCGEVVWSM